MWRIQYWTAVLATWLVISTNLKAGSTQVNLSINSQNLKDHTTEERTIGTIALNATPLTTHTHTNTDSRIKETAFGFTQNAGETVWSTDNPQSAAHSEKMEEEAKSLEALHRGDGHYELMESDQSDYADSKEDRREESDAVKLPSTGNEALSFKRDLREQTEKLRTKEWSEIISTETLRGKNTAVIQSSTSPENLEPVRTVDSGSLINPSTVREQYVANTKAFSNLKDTLKTDRLHENLENLAKDITEEWVATTTLSESVQQSGKYENEQANLNGDNSHSISLDSNRRIVGWLDVPDTTSHSSLYEVDSEPTETAKVTREFAIKAVGGRVTSVRKKSDTHELRGHRTVSYQTDLELSGHSWKDNAGFNGQKSFTENIQESNFLTANSMKELQYLRTTAIPYSFYNKESQDSPSKHGSTVNSNLVMELSAKHNDKSVEDSKKNSFGKLTQSTTEELRSSLRLQSDVEENTKDPLRATGIEFQEDVSSVHVNAQANTTIEERKDSKGENTVDHDEKKVSLLAVRKSVNVGFRGDKRRRVSKQILKTNKRRGKIPDRKGELSIHSSSRGASSRESATTIAIHRFVEQTDVTVRAPIEIERITASDIKPSVNQNTDSLPEKQGNTSKQKKQLLYVLRQNTPFSTSSTDSAQERNSNDKYDNSHDNDSLRNEKQAANVQHGDVLKASVLEIMDKENDIVDEKDKFTGDKYAITAKDAFESQREAGKLDYLNSNDHESMFHEALENSTKHVVQGEKHKGGAFRASYETRSMPDYLAEWTRSAIIRERNAIHAKSDMAGQFMKAKAVSNMENDERPPIVAKNVKLPFANSATELPGDRNDQWLTRNSKIERLTTVKSRDPMQIETKIPRQTNEMPSSLGLSMCDEQKGKGECTSERNIGKDTTEIGSVVGENLEDGVRDRSVKEEVALDEGAIEKPQLVAWDSENENETSSSEGSKTNEASTKCTEFKQTKEEEDLFITSTNKETDEEVYLEKVKETSTKGAITHNFGGLNDSLGILAAEEDARTRVGRFSRTWRNESLTNTQDSSTLPQEANTERKLADRTLSDPEPSEKYEEPGMAVTRTKIDIRPQTSPASTAGIPSSFDRTIELRTSSLLTNGIDEMHTDTTTTNWSSSSTNAIPSMETTTHHEPSSTIKQPLLDKDYTPADNTMLEMSTKHWRNIVIEGIKSDNSSHEVEPLDQWPVKHSAVVEGDLVLGGLMMVHEREDTITCGPVMPQGGVQALEAMLYTLDNVNHRNIIPGVKIGAHILDDCDKDTYGLEMAVDFIKGGCYACSY